ncbi:MAG TPA: hypothetical protein VH593_05115, partial [Ktedonobacteraceae bacterium]
MMMRSSFPVLIRCQPVWLVGMALWSCIYVDKLRDPAGTGDTMYEIWYGEEDQLQNSTPSYFADAK